MSAWALPLAIPAGLVLFLVNDENEAAFAEFCQLVARREERLDELLPKPFEDMDNAFQAEQRARLRRGDHRSLEDRAITALGDRIVRRSRPLMILNIAAAATVVLLLGLDIF